MKRLVLAYPGFRRLWMSSLCGYGAMWIQSASISWLVYELTGSAALVGAVVGVRMIPLLALAPLSGVAADRYDRRRLLQSSQWLAAGAVLAFGIGLKFEAIGIWMLFAFSLVSSTAHVLDRPARHSTVFELVPRELAPQAVTFNIVGNSSMRIFGPAIAGFLIVWVGIAGNFMVQALLYFASGALALAVVFPPRKAPARRESAVGEMMQGLRYVSADPTTRLLVSVAAIQYFIMVPVFNTLFPVYAKDVFAVGPQGLGLMFTMVGVGAVLGGVCAGVLMRLDRIGLIQSGALLVFCLALWALAASPNYAFALAACLFAGASEMVVSTTNQTMLQMSAPEHLRGRVVAIIQLNPALIAAGSLLIGPLGDAFGAAGATAVSALLCAAVVIALLARSSRLRELRLSHYRER